MGALGPHFCWSGHQQSLEQSATIAATGGRVTSPLGVRHQTQNIALCIADTGHSSYGAVGVPLVAEHHLAVVFQSPELIRLHLVTTLTMGDGKADDFTRLVTLQPLTRSRTDFEGG